MESKNHKETEMTHKTYTSTAFPVSTTPVNHYDPATKPAADIYPDVDFLELLLGDKEV